MTKDYSTYKCLKIEVEDGVAIATFNRPEVMNALNQDGLNEVHKRLFQDLNKDEEVKAIILTGAGRAFCAGADIKMFASWTAAEQAGKKPRVSGLSEGLELLEQMLDIDKPIIAAVNGPAIGLGATIALFCDIVIAAETARFGDTHISVGIVAGDGGTVMWPLLVGPAKAKELLMTGRIIDAKEADRIGLVNEVVPLKDLMPKALKLAKQLAQGPTLAIGWTKRSINTKIKQDVNLLINASLAYERLSFFTEDHNEATQAFIQKRQPKFKGL